MRDLEFADDVRALWRADTAVTRDHAERARVAAGLKGIDLDNPAERVTAQEWLDAHLIAQLAAEADQPVTETDLAPDDAALHATSDGRQPRPERAAEDRADQDVPAQPDERGEDHNRGDHNRGGGDGDADEHARSADTVDDSPPHRVRVPEDVVAPDIRDTLAPDPTERADPDHRRRVPPPDELTSTVDRAHLVLAEVTDRHAAEQAAADHAAELEPDDRRCRARRRGRRRAR